MRGRRFVRPALILTEPDGAEKRVLAELDDKPWAADDGEPWRAAFRVDGRLDPVTAIELSVAPDINVPLRGGGDEGGGRRAKRERGPVAATAPAAPHAKTRTPTRRPASRAQDTERLTTRLAAAEAAMERESRVIARAAGLADAREGIASFLEKRSPNFDGVN